MFDLRHQNQIILSACCSDSALSIYTGCHFWHSSYLNIGHLCEMIMLGLISVQYFSTCLLKNFVSF